MKKRNLYIIGCLFAAVTFTSCSKDFLEVIPVGNQIATTADDYDKILNNPDFYQAQTAGLNELVLMGDELAAEGPYFNNITAYNTRLFKWQDSIYYIDDESPYFISQNLTALFPLNLIIKEVLDAKEGSEAEKKRIRAEALAHRAWLHFQFVNFYAKPYNAATANTDPGFPIINEASINIDKYDRGTVQQTYDFIIEGFTEAIPDLSTNPTLPTRFSKPAVEALLGKVYLFMGRNTEAAEHFENALNYIAGNGRPTLYDYNVEFAPGGSFLPIDPTFGPSGPGSDRNDMREAVLSKVFKNSLWEGNMFSTDGLVLTPEAASLFLPSDTRLLLYTNTNQDGSTNSAGHLRKYSVYSRFGMELPELYLLSAEAKARLNNLTGAKADVEMLRRHRMPEVDAEVPSDTASNQLAMITFIINERIREFAREGYRWYDMRRLSVDPLFAPLTFKHIIYNSDGTEEVFTLNQPNRLTLKIPPRIARTNPDFENNP